MSWQTYVDQNLVGTKAVAKAAILGHDGNKWAATAGFNVSAEEGKKLFQAYKDPSGIRAQGIHLAGSKYLALRADDRSVYGKQGAGGVITVKTNKAILIGVYDDKSQPGQAANVVEKLADYLIEQGY